MDGDHNLIPFASGKKLACNRHLQAFIQYSRISMDCEFEAYNTVAQWRHQGGHNFIQFHTITQHKQF